MAGLIDARILQPELAGSFAAGYRGAEQARQQTQQNQQQFEMNQMKLDQLKQDRAALTDLQSKLRARGQSDDPTFFFRSLIETGNPDYVVKGYEGLQRYKELERADALLRREAPELFGSSPAAAVGNAAAPVAAAPATRNALAPAVEGMFSTPSAATVEAEKQQGRLALFNRMAAAGVTLDAAAPGLHAPAANALTPTVAASAPAANALAATAPDAATPDANARIRELRNKILSYRSVNDPRLKSLADVYEAELKELTKPQTLSPGQQIFSGGRVVYTAPAAPAAPRIEVIGVAKGTDTPVYFDKDAREQFTIATDPSGKQIKKLYTGGVNRSTSTVTAPVDVKVNAFVPASETAQAEYMKGARTTFEALRNAQPTLDNIDKAKALVAGAQGFMGTGGEPLLAAASFLNNRLGTSINTAGVTDAQELRSRLFFGILDNLKKLDSQPSQQQQNALQQALGSIGTDPAALPRVLDAFADSIRTKVNLYNQDVTSAEERGVRFPYRPQIRLTPRVPSPGEAAAQIPTTAPAARAPAASAGNAVTLPDGRVMTFPNADAAAKFRKDTGL